MKQEHATISNLNMDSSSLQPKTGYWVWAKEAGTLNLPAAGGTLADETYAWNKLRFHNGTDELNASDAVNSLWAYNTHNYSFVPGWRGGGSWGLTQVVDYNTFTLNPWQGYFIKSDYDNITLIRQN